MATLLGIPSSAQRTRQRSYSTRQYDTIRHRGENSLEGGKQVNHPRPHALHFKVRAPFARPDTDLCIPEPSPGRAPRPFWTLPRPLLCGRGDTHDAGCWAPGARGAVRSLPSPRCCPGCLRPLQQPSQDQCPGSWAASPELYLLSTRPGRITDGQTCLGRKEGTLGAVAPKGPARRDPDPPRAWQGPGSPAQLCGSNQWRLPSPSLSSPPSLSLSRVTV